METVPPTPDRLWSVTESCTSREDWPESPPPPWRARVRATVWWHRATDEAAGFGPGGRAVPLTIGMVVDYLDPPVGPYREVLASPVLLAPSIEARTGPAIAVPFIAVDSERSVHGGRTHWRLPKVLATFTGDVARDVVASGDGWTVRVASRPFGVRVPAIGLLPFAQPSGDGAWLRSSARLRGHARPARVEVNAEGPTLSRWLAPGRHLGVVITDGRLTVGAPSSSGSTRPQLRRSSREQRRE